ncbi:MAG: hypothetical protein AAFY20_12230 [Cyanobacteria bacterium J06639_14]
MIPARSLISWLDPLLVRQSLVALVAALMVWLVDGVYRSGHAEPGSIVIDMPVYSQVTHGDLIIQAEGLVEAAINRQFGQVSELLKVEVVVLGNRNGEMVPILTTVVSRNQWQENPQVNAWTQYYSNSYALLQRHEERPGGEERVAAIPQVSSVNRTSSSSIDRAYDEGRLTGREIQRGYLDDLD